MDNKEELKKPSLNEEEEKLGTEFPNHSNHVKISVIGNVDSGKSTLVGVLTKGLKDDGRGSARLRIFNYPHEAQNGRTSSIAHEIMGFDETATQVLPDRKNQTKNKYWAEVVSKSSNIVTLLDLCGHEKYLKTTIFGLVGLCPDYSMIIVGANMGLTKMTREHLGVTLALKIPFFVVLTKIDMCPKNVYDETTDSLVKILKTKIVDRYPIFVKDESEVKTCENAIQSDRVCPIFPISSVTGEGVPQLIKFISLLKSRMPDTKKDEPLEFDINETFMVPGVGIVVSGLLKAGTAKINQQLLLGPDKTRNFLLVSIKSIHVSRVPVNYAEAGQFACFCIKPLKTSEKLTRDSFRKGMVIIDPTIKPNPVIEFDADVVILHHSTTIKEGYQAVMHAGVVRQAVKIVSMENELLRTGEKSIVRFRFLYNAEFLKNGMTVLLREGRTKILGMITNISDAPSGK